MRRRFGDVEGDEPEVARLQDERERAQRLLERALIHVAAQSGIRHDMATDPEQPLEIDAGCHCRLDIERVEDIDERYELSAGRRCRQQVQQYARAAR